MEKHITKEEALEIIEAIRREAADLPEMSLEEINAEIKAVREERRNKENQPSH